MFKGSSISLLFVSYATKEVILVILDSLLLDFPKPASNTKPSNLDLNLLHPTPQKTHTKIAASAQSHPSSSDSGTLLFIPQ